MESNIINNTYTCFEKKMLLHTHKPYSEWNQDALCLNQQWDQIVPTKQRQD